MGPIGVISFGIAAGLCFLPTAALAGEPARTVLATGDAVPGFGSIGSRGFATLAATNDGRLIVTASLSDGRSGVFFVENRQLVTIVTSDQQPGIELALVSAHPDGTVMVPVRGPGWPRRYTLHVFKSDGTTAIIQPPSSDVAGNQFCWVDPHNAKVNSSGEVAFRAEIAPRGGSCEHGDRVSAIYLARGAEVEPILAELRRLGEKHGGRTPSQVALNWLICKGCIPIPGAKNGAQAEQNAGALGWRLDAADVDKLDCIAKPGLRKPVHVVWQHG